ncbi:MAG: acetyltransferase, partial [Chromatiales bacterium]|nr:acetyltransferase [Chromatiales bacterium]
MGFNPLHHLRGAFTISVFTLNVVFWFIPIVIVGLAKLLVPASAWRDLMSRWLSALGENWISCNGLILALTQSIEWDVEGNTGLARRGWYLVVSNHQSWVDILVLQKVFNRRIPFLKFFIKQQLIWVPFLGLAWWAMDMPFMRRFSREYLAKHPEMKGKDLEATRQACEKFERIPTSIINFVEGTRVTPAKQRE